ncbi:MAG: tRNA (adenosine(37)-N6)-threonylcarbamoyltransferase complex ATPase subunit type 1 TsaE [Patescibacteria group bacterium]|nr:tRNA (adenosine(37)-N6)-threonylcarbamoyltransferase complex ATPase subunit type 1 TsaE [Patescibacteria group bacterium]MDE2218554.1 tRNA (adenosine(37)-N6)-threonylcarbamoyltransferase complex ATPase subunit type 1 TsaE [Patescibacteria group bacterium]
MKIISKNLEETEKVARNFIEKEFVRNEGDALIVGLYGDLGSGKTTFTQAVAKCLGVKETVTSPTFVIEKIYKLNGGKFDHLIHIDAYRLESGGELIHLGWEEIAKNPKNIIFVEWPERVAEIFPKDIKKIFFTFVDKNARIIEIKS